MVDGHGRMDAAEPSSRIAWSLTLKVYTDDHALLAQDMPFFEIMRASTAFGRRIRPGRARNQWASSRFWSMLKRAHTGTFHKISPKHMDRYVTEFAGRHNDRQADTLDQMGTIVRGMIGRRISYADLTAS